MAIHTYELYESSVNLTDDFGMREEAAVPGENLHKYREHASFTQGGRSG